MEKFVETYQPIISIHVEDDLFGTSRLSIVPHEQTKALIKDHYAVEKRSANTYALGFRIQHTTEHNALEDILESDGSLNEKRTNRILVTYDYQQATQEFTRDVILPEADAETVTEDLDDHIFENSLLLRFLIKVNPLLKDSLLPEDNLPKLVFTDDINTPSNTVREKHIVITSIEEDGILMKWEIDEEDKPLEEITVLNLENDVLAECLVNIPAHLASVHSIHYHIHMKHKTIYNP